MLARFDFASPNGPKRTTPIVKLVTQSQPVGSRTLPTHLRDHGVARGERGALLVLHAHAVAPLAFFGIGEIRTFTPQEALEWGEVLGHRLAAEKLTTIHLELASELTSDAEASRDVLLCLLKGLALSSYRLQELPKRAGAKPETVLAEITISGGDRSPISRADLEQAKISAVAIARTRELAELPANVATPSGVLRLFQKWAAPFVKNKTLEIEIWDEKRLAREKMGLLLAVGAASHEPPRFAIVRYGSHRKLPGNPLFLVGKGVTFDTGGINLKTVPYKELIAMKSDMSGAAAVLSAMIAIAELEPKIPVTAVVPLTTNAIGSRATLPGDVITSYSGKTVEIQNTDAEGRLVLADAVHYAVTHRASGIIDVATLTGACAVALGTYHSGLFSNHRELGLEVLGASVRAGEPCWLMPTSPRYGEELKSKVADLSNMGRSREGGAQLGAKFIEAFVGTTPWCHLDIAGTMEHGPLVGGVSPIRATGRMTDTLIESVMGIAERGGLRA